MRITREEIKGAIELFVNCIYDDGEDSGWLDATLEDWIKAVYEELTTWKTIGGWSYHSNENRFEGKSNIINRIKPLLKNRLNELKEKGFEIKAL